MQKQAAKNVMKQQLQQVDPDLYDEYYNYNFKITLLPSLDVIDHKIWSINRAKSLAGPDPTSNNVVDIISIYLSLNTK